MVETRMSVDSVSDALRSLPAKCKRILILGGTTFMGRALVRRILRDHVANLECLVMVNRGRKYWPQEHFLPANLFHSSNKKSIGVHFSKVKHVQGDRTKKKPFSQVLFKATLEYCSNLQLQKAENGGFASTDELFDALRNNFNVRSKMVQKKDNFLHVWDAIIDFSAFNADDIRCVESGVLSAVNLGFDLHLPGCEDLSKSTYIYISSDSCYEVCDVAARDWAESSGNWTTMGEKSRRISEGEARRPEDKIVRKRLNKKDSYGHGKLRAEEALYHFGRGLYDERPSLRSSMTTVCLRLPDVLGPYDDTGRLWAYWFQIFSNEPIVLKPNDERQVIAVVFGSDIGRIVVDIVFSETYDQQRVSGNGRLSQNGMKDEGDHDNSVGQHATSRRDSEMSTDSKTSIVDDSLSNESLSDRRHSWAKLRRLRGNKPFAKDGSFLALNFGCIEQLRLRSHLEVFRNCVLSDVKQIVPLLKVRRRLKSGSDSDEDATQPSSYYDHNEIALPERYFEELQKYFPSRDAIDSLSIRIMELGRQASEPRVVGLDDMKYAKTQFSTRQFLPSVDRVPELDYSLLKLKFPNYTPTKLEDVYLMCHRFFLLGCYQFPEEAKDALKKLIPAQRANVAKVFYNGESLSSSESSSDSD